MDDDAAASASSRFASLAHPAAAAPYLLGKEFERSILGGLDRPRAVTDETARLVTDPRLTCEGRRVSIRAWARAAEVSENTVKAARRGDRLRKSTVEKLMKALSALLVPKPSGLPSGE